MNSMRAAISYGNSAFDGTPLEGPPESVPEEAYSPEAYGCGSAWVAARSSYLALQIGEVP